MLTLGGTLLFGSQQYSQEVSMLTEERLLLQSGVMN